jgi:hypothetical protein
VRADQFQSQMNRLVEQFGKQAYGTERCKLIWQVVQDLELAWFTGIVDQFIGECRLPPLMPEFRDAIAKERERLWKIQKQQNEKDAQAFFEGTYDAEDTRTICQTIVKRLTKGVPDEDYANFIKLLNQAAQKGD